MQDGSVKYHNSQVIATHRDNNRCMLSGKDGFAILQAVHIIPEAYNKRIEGGDDDRCEMSIYDYLLVPTQDAHSTGILAFLLTFTNVNIAEELARKLFHPLENILTLHSDCHRYFADLCLWPKPMIFFLVRFLISVRRAHMYQVNEVLQGLKSALGIPNIVAFNTATEFPLSEPALLVLHGLCCEVAWMFGAVALVETRFVVH